MNHETTVNLRSWKLFSGFSETDIEKLLARAERRDFRSGERICKQGDAGESMFIIYSGRVNMRVAKGSSQEQNLNTLKQGDHFGELVLLSGGVRTASAIAISDVEVLEINKAAFKELTRQIPVFAINLSRTIGGWLQGELKGEAPRKKLHIIAVVRSCETTADAAIQIVSWFKQQGKKLTLFSDRENYWQSQGIKIQPFSNANSVSVQTAIITASERYDHVFLDIEDGHELLAIVSQCERIWWLQQQTAPAKQSLALAERLLVSHASLRDQLQWVWLQPPSHGLAALPENIPVTNINDIRCQYQPGDNSLRARDLARFYHLANGIQIGIALGGGGARSLAHVGVLAALEEHGIYVDRISGTSGGAIMSAFYAAGFDSQRMLNLFYQGLNPPRWLRHIRQGNKWFLMALFRLGLIEKRFYQVFDPKVTFDQLYLPTHIISSDLISGKEVVRSQGSVADSVLESINHPLLGRPIFRDGEALVDGGILNNVPSSVLRAHGADYVISVSIGAQLGKTFGKNTVSTSKDEMKKVGLLGTLFRVLEVGQYGLENRYEAESDFLILPDTSSYLFEDLHKGQELYEVGYQETLKIMPELKASYQEFMQKE